MRKSTMLILGLAALTAGNAILVVSIATEPAKANPEGWNVVMSVGVNDRSDDYVLDSGLSLGDCQSALEGVRPTFEVVREASVAVTYACERK